MKKAQRAELKKYLAESYQDDDLDSSSNGSKSDGFENSDSESSVSGAEEETPSFKSLSRAAFRALKPPSDGGHPVAQMNRGGVMKMHSA